MIAKLMARWSATPCSLLFIPFGFVGVPSTSHLALGLMAAVAASWLAWKSWAWLREWDRRDRLALKKLTLAINVLALMAGTTAIVRLHLRATQSPPPSTPTYPSGVMPDSQLSTHDDVPPLPVQPPIQTSLTMRDEPDLPSDYCDAERKYVATLLPSGRRNMIGLEAYLNSLANDERRHPYQRGPAPITRLGL